MILYILIYKIKVLDNTVVTILNMGTVETKRESRKFIKLNEYISYSPIPYVSKVCIYKYFYNNNNNIIILYKHIDYYIHNRVQIYI